MYVLIEPELGRISGGLRYNRGIADASERGIVRHHIAGSWPEPADADIAALYAMIERFEQPVLLDGLIGCSLPVPLDTTVPVVQLVHALAETDEAKKRERNCLQAADAVVATSQFAADQLEQRYGLRATVAVPGVDRRPQAYGEDGAHFICVGALEPNKNQLFLADTFCRLQRRTDTPWHCTFAGSGTDPDYAKDVVAALNRLPASRTSVVGELSAAELAELYSRADLLLLPSRREAYGLVVREAAAAGIPSMVAAGTGAEEALGAGCALELDEHQWSAALVRWLNDHEHRAGLQEEAQQLRQDMPYGWERTANQILRVLGEAS